jgi:hypothetical protein
MVIFLVIWGGVYCLCFCGERLFLFTHPTLSVNEKFLRNIMDLHSGAFFREIGKAIWRISSLVWEYLELSEWLCFGIRKIVESKMKRVKI